MRSAEPRFPNRKSRPVSGILLLDKPSGLSSNQALQRVRRLYDAAKGGHTGSLDPLATGLLPICLGEATKIAGLLLGAAKGYDAEARLGVTTGTDDAEGEVLESRPLPPLDRSTIERALQALRGTIVQRPPVYSALKRDGVPLYRRARRGERVEPASRSVEVSRFDLLEAIGDRLYLRIECGSGTYVRSLVRDLGERLGCGAHVTALRRTWADPFRAPRLYPFDELESVATGGHAALDALLLPIEEGLAGQPSISVDAEMALALRQGRGVRPPGADAVGRRVVLDMAGRVVALAEAGPDGVLRPLRVFHA
jgi:tRNA pseudouridine55 synthase